MGWRLEAGGNGAYVGEWVVDGPERLAMRNTTKSEEHMQTEEHLLGRNRPTR